MNNTNLNIYESLVDAYNSGYFWYFFSHISEDIRFSNSDFKIEGAGTFKTYFDHIGYEMEENNEHSIASLGELKSHDKSRNLKKHINKDKSITETYPDGELVILLRQDQFTRPKSIIFLEFNEKGCVNGMYITDAYHYEYNEIQNSKALSIFELNKIAIDEAEKLFKSQGFHVERTEIQVQTLPHLRIYGADEYDFNVFVFADNYPFSGQKNKKVEDYLIFEGFLDYMATKLMYVQVEGLGKDRSKILPTDRYTVEFKNTKDIPIYHQSIGDRNE